MRRLTTEIFIERAKKVHGDKYNYSKVEYRMTHDHVQIVCPKHGEFWQMPSNHLRGNGCPVCAGNKKLSVEDFVKAARSTHGKKYDYSKANYKNYDDKVCIICPEHGEFWQTPSNHLCGRGCLKCSKDYLRNLFVKDKNEFISSARRVHGNKYDYSKVNYINSKTKVEIICFKHGSFWQLPANHLQGNGCPVCNDSILESKVFQLLSDLNLTFDCQKRFEWLLNDESNSAMSLDFYLPEYNLCIECQGIQHFVYEEFLHRNDYNNYVQQQVRDDLKYDLCEQHNIDILYFAEAKDYINGYRYPVITDIGELKEELLLR